MTSITSLAGQVIIITGGTGRLGTGVTKKLLSCGAKVIVTYTKDAELEKLKAEIAGDETERFTGRKVDVTDPAAVQDLINAVMQDHKKIDGLVNLVGGWESKSITEITLEDWQKQMNLNLTSAFLMSKAVLPHMIAAKYGRILGVGAQSAIQASKEQAHYNVSKVGVMWLMESISNEVKQHGITANAILPSSIQTLEEHAAKPGKGAWVSPAEVAELVAYLMSPESGATSGAKIPVYGKA